jgi:uncharacterized protein YggE
MEDQKDTRKLKLTVDPRPVILILLAIIIGMLLMWRPWAVAGDRVVEVTGEAKVTAVPDEFIFYPSYNFEGNNSSAQAALTKKTDEVVAKLKELGVPEQKIKVNSSSYAKDPTLGRPGIEPERLSVGITVTVGDKELAQKVQDYLLTTNTTGTITPQPGFSDDKRRELEDQARDEATKDARRKADQMAKNLGFKVGAVKSVSVQPDYRVLPMAEATDSVAPGRSLSILPGENDLTYTVTVSYYIR